MMARGLKLPVTAYPRGLLAHGQGGTAGKPNADGLPFVAA